MRSCFEPDESKRPTAQMLMTHPFLTQKKSKSEARLAERSRTQGSLDNAEYEAALGEDSGEHLVLQSTLSMKAASSGFNRSKLIDLSLSAVFLGFACSQLVLVRWLHTDDYKMSAFVCVLSLCDTYVT